MHVANKTHNFFLICKDITTKVSELTETDFKVAKVAFGALLVASSVFMGASLPQLTCVVSVITLTYYAPEKMSYLFNYYFICKDLPETSRLEVIKYASPLFHWEMTLEEKSKIAAFINTIDPNNRADIINNYLELKIRYNSDSTLLILEEIAKVPANQRSDVTINARKIIEKGFGAYILCLSTIAEIPQADRADVIENALQLLAHGMTMKEIVNLIKNTAAIPPQERRSIIESFPGFALMNKMSKSINPLLMFYLLPENLRSIEILELLQAEGINLIDSPEYLKMILDSCDQKLSNPKMQQQTLYEIANFVCTHYKTFGLNVECDLVKKAAELYSTPEKEMPGAMGLYGKLLNLAKTAPNFQPRATKVNELQGFNVAINMTQIKAISNERIKREDLPADATVENWNQIINAFLNKIQNNHKIHGSLFRFIQHTEFTTASEFLASVSMTTVNDKEKFLTQLLESKSSVPSNTEAKFKKIVSYIWNKNHNLRINNDFTEREEAFIIAMSLIKHCSQGKTQGIDAYYNTFDDKDKYSMKLATPKTVEQRLEEKNKNKGRKFVKSWLNSTAEEKKQSFPDKLFNSVNPSWGQGKAIPNAELPPEKKVAALKKFARKDTKKSSEKLKGLADNEAFYDVSDDYEYALNDQGADIVLKLYYQEQPKEFVLTFVTEVVRKFIDNHFTGSGLLMQELTGEKIVSQPPHQLPYLKNLIGVHLGTTHEIIFDEYTGCISRKMLQRSREEILGIFFKHASPNRMVTDLMLEVNAEIDVSENTNKLFRDFLPEDKFWTIKIIKGDWLWQSQTEKRVLNPIGAIELLKAFDLITLTKTGA